MIPHILHQTWKTRGDLPAGQMHWRDSFFDLNPGIEDRFYDDDDNRALVGTLFPSLLALYDSFPREIFRVDFVRPLYLFRDGGIYADLDFQCLADLTGAGLRDADILLGRMGTDESMRHSIPNAFMASRPGQAFWIGYLACIERSWRRNRTVSRIDDLPEWVTGPVVLQQAARLYANRRADFEKLTRSFIERHDLGISYERLGQGKLTILPPHLLYPLSWKDQIHRMFLRRATRKQILYSAEEARRLFPGSLAVTWWAASWKAPER